MIRSRVVVSRYAEAFWGFANESCGTEKALEDLASVKNVIRDNPGFKQLLDSPRITQNEKAAIIDEVLKEVVGVEMRDFLKFLIEKKRFLIFADIAEYLRAKYSHHGQVGVLLRTAFPLPLDLIRKIETALKERIKRDLRFYIDLDGSLLGGVQVIVGNTIIDGSVRKRLELLKEKIAAVKTH